MAVSVRTPGQRGVLAPTARTRSWTDDAGRAVWLLALLVTAGVFGALIWAAARDPHVVQNLLSILTANSLRDALLRTYIVAIVSSLLVLVAGIAFIFAWRLDPREQLVPILRAPLLLHGFPAGMAFLVVFGNAGWINRVLQLTFHLSGPPLPLAFSVAGLIVFFVIFGLPYLLAYALFSIRRDIAELEDAARLLGCGPAEAYRRVTLPLLLGPLRTATALAFVLAAGSLSVPMIIGGGRASLLPAEIYGVIIGSGDIARAAALALGYVVALMPALLLIDRLTVWGVTWFTAASPKSSVRTSLGERQRQRRTAWAARGYQALWFLTLAILVLAPLYASFVLQWGAGVIATAFTGQWYAAISAQFWDSLWLSFGVSLACIGLSLVGALPLALAWRFTPIPGKRLLRSLVLVPIAVPGFLWGIGVLVFFQAVAPALSQTPLPLLLGEAWLALPFMLRVLMTGLDDIDSRVLEVAAGLGASSRSRFSRVLLPMLAPSLAMGSLLVFIRSFGESNLALVLAPVRYPTAALWLLQGADTAGIGLASAMDTILVIAPLVLLMIGELALRRNLKWARARAALPV